MPIIKIEVNSRGSLHSTESARVNKCIVLVERYSISDSEYIEIPEHKRKKVESCKIVTFRATLEKIE